MADDNTQSDPHLAMRRLDDQGVVQFGVEVGGAFYELGVVKTGDFDARAQQARDRADEQQQQQTEQQQPTQQG